MTLKLRPDEIEALVHYLADPSDKNEIWRGLLFMEANDLDWSARSDQLHAYLVSPDDSPLAERAPRTVDDERAILLQMRDRARDELRLPPLSAAEKAAWHYQGARPFKYPPEKMKSKPASQMLVATAAEKEDLLRWFWINERLFTTVLFRFLEENNLFPDGDARKHDTMWAMGPLRRGTLKARPDLDGVDISAITVDSVLYAENPDVRRRISGDPPYR